ncbi:armadillo repeat-containing protein 5 [Thrips palmi]|uniref:Armadillo repeat-containing protein 5 n=1 Tax=Thrips palmi TaxID=161013 RepID=A0A6P8Z3R9_THRPL|nr:armadillo repeat-containing protein 5 [Thrips palmi]
MSSQETLNLPHILKQLESTSSSVAFRGLQEIRFKVLKAPNGAQLFKQYNGLKYLFRFVRKPNEKILDLTLSILGNLCLEDDIKTKVAEENGFIAHILNLITHMQKDSIIGRACRLLGNLATNQIIAVTLHQKGAVPKLIESIKSKDTSPGTKHMAVRALRLLWEADSNRNKMLQDQVVHTVASLLSTPVDELLQAVLKALGKFTYKCSERCALQVQGDGKGFEELIASLKQCSKSELPISVILNLCFVSEVRPLLGTAGVVEAVLSLASDTSGHKFSSDIVSILSLLCRESVNRSKIRRNGGLDVLLDTLKCGSHPNVEARALNAMLHFIYDEVGLEILIKEGLVPVLVNKLVKVVDNHGSTHVNQNRKGGISTPLTPHKRMRFSGSTEETPLYSYDNDPLGLKTRELASTSCRTDTNTLSGHWSPGSSRSVEFSPDTTRMYSPPPLNISCSPTSSALSPASQSSPPSPLSDAYSPVCGYSSSEDEKPDDTDAEVTVECEVDSDCEVTSPHLKDKDDVDDIQDALSASLPSNVTSRHGLVESWCLLLLSRVSHMDSLVEDMVSSNTLDALLQYYTLLDPPHPRAARILQRIARNHQYLVPLLRAGLVLKVNARLTGRIHDGCSRCLEFDGLGKSLLSQISVIAESGFGEGEIAHSLMRATRPVQTFLIISIPYIIRKRKLMHLMMNCKVNEKSALDLLFQLMTDECGDGLSSEAVNSISRLARQIGALSIKTLNLSNSQLCKRGANNCSKNILKFSSDELSADVVVLELDNGTFVSVRKGEMCEESPMFAAMLTGSFYESGRERVAIKDVCKENLCSVLSLMRAPAWCRCCLIDHDTSFAFEVLKLADRFILPKVVNKVADWLLTQLAPDVIPLFYSQAQNLRHVLSMSEKLSKESLQFALSEDIDPKKRYKIFSTILNSELKEQFIEDLSVLLKFHLDQPHQLH